MFQRRWIGSLWLIMICTEHASPLIAATPGKADTAQVDQDHVRKAASTIPAELTFRTRVPAIQPGGTVTIQWRYGGEGLGGNVYRDALAGGLNVGQWTESCSLSSLIRGPWPPAFQGRYWFLTFTVNDTKSRGLEMEFEFSYRGQVIKSFRVASPDGATVGIAVPHWRLSEGRQPTDPEFLRELGGLKEHAERRAKYVAALPWAKGPVPQRFMIATDVGGYGQGVGYGVRHCERAIVETEVAVLRQMGVNSLRGAPDFLRQMARRHEGFAKDLGLAEVDTAMGFPVPSYRKGGKNGEAECGCPFGSQVARRTAELAQAAVDRNLQIPVSEVWALTVDEIGSVFDLAPEGKKHIETCPRCIEGFRQYVKSRGAAPADFGQSDWTDVKPVYEGGPKASTYYARKFGNYATARLFTPLAQAFETQNANKRRALAAGDKSAAVARQPWIYSYALRGNTFLMGGHSLDFFDFYRYADNAFMYETSNRGWQIWQWDSYLCDVGRTLDERMQKRFGIIVKPHRGAPLQRALSAVSRGAKLLYWYTYGPDYSKGDTFGSEPEAVALAVKAAHLIGKAEDALWESKWARPAEIAIVKPRCAEILGSDEQWENAKWVYTALAHAHLPVEAIDEVMLAGDDLSKYKIIYVNGSHLPRRAAQGLARYVAAGGVLWTSGWGCARDEADEPLPALAPALGLQDRESPQAWYKVERYKATVVQSFADAKARISPVPEAARLEGSGPYAASFLPVVGREVLRPASDSRVLARFADGGAAMTVHPHGKGRVYVVGFFPGLEYSAAVRAETADMSRDFDTARRSFIAQPALEVTRPVVDASVPAVEGVLLRNAANGKQAVTLMNWAYRSTPAGRGKSIISLVELNDVKVAIRAVAPVKRVTSAILDRELPIERQGETLNVTLPRLEEGDVLLLE